ncbi:hypothetical protein MAQ5080_00054 [Marinomonas aquimarina]|uniref:Uncharacterized protein n=1 Tax=Marinomonas aquimarina TaxID=295068 RepID=A0A1A8T1Z5_9GAMM|nr:hypothetical protein [Marinomonas aquimarina]SBS24633.1 hypothetical protein MAQ5080_00054 [Marinomonas aquimarina]
MKDNIIPFPVASKARGDDTAVEQTVDTTSVKRLHELRHAFDEARKLWPLELSELPEQNRKQVASRKR